MQKNIQAPKGTKDVLPADSHKWHYIEKTIRELCALYGAHELRTPIIEHTELFLRGVGDTTDIVQKEMYTFEDKGGRSITLKPEGTAGMVRAFIENRLFNEPMPQKLYYLNSPTFRYEKPQAGRLREHHQFGIEMVGSFAPETDAEVILLALTLFKKLGVNDLMLHINSIGCPECRKDYNTALREYLSRYIGDMCETCRSRFEKNPMRIIDCKEERCKQIVKNAPRTIDYLCDSCRTHFEGVKACLDAVGANYVIDPDIVRGLDYYTGTVFEVISNRIGAQGAVCAGGRYNGLIEELGGQALPAVGFGLGMERLLAVMEANEAAFPTEERLTVYFAAFGDAARKKAFALTQELREKGVSAEFDHMDRSFKAQFKYANKLDAKYTVAIGDEELERNLVKVKCMADGEEQEVSLSSVCGYFMD
ncbi:MAG: histidine--tRNA ligase [Clostridia bacterium]|nr:histidine--tRNA ligase [Clostridia bacterium]MBR5713801.1 histidine--tRNA ligase [Clostridia bacterium]